MRCSYFYILVVLFNYTVKLGKHILNLHVTSALELKTSRKPCIEHTSEEIEAPTHVIGKVSKTVH